MVGGRGGGGVGRGGERETKIMEGKRKSETQKSCMDVCEEMIQQQKKVCVFQKTQSSCVFLYVCDT